MSNLEASNDITESGMAKVFGRYVATDGGIVEYHVDIAGRKVFPSFTPR